MSIRNVADKTNLGKNVNTTIWATWSKFHKTDNPGDAKTVLLEMPPL